MDPFLQLICINLLLSATLVLNFSRRSNISKLQPIRYLFFLQLSHVSKYQSITVKNLICCQINLYFFKHKIESKVHLNMNQSLEVTNVKHEPTDSISSERLEIPSKIQMGSIKEHDHLIQSELDMKKEPQEDENELSVIASTSFQMYSYNKIKFEPKEQIIKTECEDLVDKLMKDPLDVGREIKVEKQFPSTEREKEEILLEIDKDNSHGSRSNQGQDQLLIRNDSDRKYKKHVCSECSKMFNNKSNLDRHLRIHTGEKPFICNICTKSFTEKGHLNKHMLIHCDEKTHVCDVCKKTFRHKISLVSHKLIHSGMRPFSCDVCNKSFNKKINLVIHMRLHTGEKPFACDLCKKEFADQSALIRHRRLHTGEKPYSCDVCKKSFAQQPGLYQHKRAHKH